tara:strand:- start:269 stop:613 length:345 start_codon:yes stop_codon:yes gene_type:complete
MGLGNNMSMGQARGKAKSVIAKRHKEVTVARGYNSITSSPVQPRPACGYPGSMSETFYHNGTSAAPDVNDIIYSTRRARSNNKITAGHYKIVVGKSTYSIEVDSAGVIRSRSNC